MRRDLSRPGVRGGVMGWRGRREPIHGGSHAASMPRDAPPSHHPSTDPWRRSRHRDARAEQAGIDCVTGDSGPRQDAHRPSTAAVASSSLFETGELGDGASRGMDAACEPPRDGFTATPSPSSPVSNSDDGPHRPAESRGELYQPGEGVPEWKRNSGSGDVASSASIAASSTSRAATPLPRLSASLKYSPACRDSAAASEA